MNNPLRYTDPTGYFFDDWYDFVNPLEYLSWGMQKINDNTEDLRAEMRAAGVPDFNVTYSGGKASMVAGPHNAQAGIAYDFKNNRAGFAINDGGATRYYYPTYDYSTPERNAMNYFDQAVLEEGRSIRQDARDAAANNTNTNAGQDAMYEKLGKADFINAVPVGYSLWGLEQSFNDFSTQTLKNAQIINGKVFTAAELTIQYQGMMSGIAKGANILGQGSFYAGAFISSYQFYVKPTAMNGTFASMDIAYGYVGAYGGPPGWIAAGYYNTIKYTIGWERMTGWIYNSTMITNKMNEIHPKWCPYVPAYLKR